MVGVAELESATPCVSCKCSNQLSYTPKSIILMIKPHLPYPLQAFFTTNLLQPLENKSKHAIYIIVIHSFSLIFRFLQKKMKLLPFILFCLIIIIYYFLLRYTTKPNANIPNINAHSDGLGTALNSIPKPVLSPVSNCFHVNNFLSKIVTSYIFYYRFLL